MRTFLRFTGVLSIAVWSAGFVVFFISVSPPLIFSILVILFSIVIRIFCKSCNGCPSLVLRRLYRYRARIAGIRNISLALILGWLGAPKENMKTQVYRSSVEERARIGLPRFLGFSSTLRWITIQCLPQQLHHCLVHHRP